MLKDIPENFKELDDDSVCSNFDHQINYDIVERIQNETVFGFYPGWDFAGFVWFEDREFFVKIMQYQSHVDTLSAKTFEELKSRICEKYGYG